MVKLTEKEKVYLKDEIEKRLHKLYPDKEESVSIRNSYIVKTQNLHSKLKTEKRKLEYNDPYHLEKCIPSDLLIKPGRGKHLACLKRPVRIFHFIPRPAEGVDHTFENLKLLTCILNKKREKSLKLLFKNSDFGKNLLNNSNYISLDIDMIGKSYLNFEYTYYIS